MCTYTVGIFGHLNLKSLTTCYSIQSFAFSGGKNELKTEKWRFESKALALDLRYCGQSVHGEKI
jgi:hypothetical protein